MSSQALVRMIHAPVCWFPQGPDEREELALLRKRVAELEDQLKAVVGENSGVSTR